MAVVSSLAGGIRTIKMVFSLTERVVLDEPSMSVALKPRSLTRSPSTRYLTVVCVGSKTGGYSVDDDCVIPGSTGGDAGGGEYGNSPRLGEARDEEDRRERLGGGWLPTKA